MRGRKTRYTFVIEFLGGTYVHQASGESPELALRAWLCSASGEDFEWAIHREALLEAILEQCATPVEGCQNVWSVCGLAGDHLFLIHIIASDSGSAAGTRVAEKECEHAGADPKRWSGWGDRW